MASPAKLKGAIACKLSRGGLAVQGIAHQCRKEELDESVDDHPEQLETLVFICKSGMLTEIGGDIRRQHFLRPSNKYFHNASRNLFGFMLSKMHKACAADLLQTLTNVDPDSIWKLAFFATCTHKQSKIPTRHKLSFIKLMKDSHIALGKRLEVFDWASIAEDGEIDLQKYGVFAKVVEGEEIVSIKHNLSGTAVQLKRPVPANMVLVSNWLESEARLKDPADIEDYVSCIKKCPKLRSTPTVWEESLIKKTQLEQGADNIAGEGDLGHGRAQKKKRKGTSAPPAKFASVPATCQSSQGLAAPPLPAVPMIKATRTVGGAVRRRMC